MLIGKNRLNSTQIWFNRHSAWFLGLAILAIIIFIKPLAIVVGSSVSVDQYSQILIAAPLSVALVYLEKSAIYARVSFSKWGAVAFAVACGAFATTMVFAAALEPSLVISISILLFSFCCIAAFWFSYGDKALWSGLFPVCFLVVMTPLPDALRLHVITFLQYGSAVVTDWFFSAANIPFSRDGVIIMLPTVTIEIAQECSGIRSSMILVIAGLVLAHLFLRKIHSKIILLVLLVPLTIIKNALRIFSLSTLGMYVNESFLTGRLHHQGGVVFFALAFFALWALVWILQKVEGRLMPIKSVL